MKKTLLYISRLLVGSLLITLAVLYFRFKKLFDSLIFDYSISGLSLSNINLLGTSKINANINLIIDNPTTIKLKLTDVSLEIKQNGRLIANTENVPQINIKSKGKSIVDGTVNVYINKENLSLLQKMMQGTQQVVKMYIRFRIFGIKLRIPSDLIIDKNKLI